MKFSVVSRVCVDHESSKIQKLDNLLFSVSVFVLCTECKKWNDGKSLENEAIITECIVICSVYAKISTLFTIHSLSPMPKICNRVKGFTRSDQYNGINSPFD